MFVEYQKWHLELEQMLPPLFKKPNDDGKLSSETNM